MERYEVRLLKHAVEFIQGLPVKMRAKIFRTIGLLETFGYRLAEPHAKFLAGHEGLKELRVQIATDICRLFYFYFKGKIYVVTSGYQKKKAKTDPREIEKALRLMIEFKEGGGKHENS